MAELGSGTRRLQRAFERAATAFDSTAALHREIAGRMLERLAYVKVSAQRILDAGSATGYSARQLATAFPSATVTELDVCADMLRQRANRRGFLRSWLGLRGRRFPVCADFQRMPLKESTYELAWSNLALHWASDFGTALTEIYRVLQPGGLLMFSVFGPDTLTELRQASVDEEFRVNAHVDMHDIGDILVHSGFAGPVMDMEYLTLTYPDLGALLHDLRAHGSISTNQNGRRALRGRSVIERVARRYDVRRRDDGRLPATFEIIYGHAWKPDARVSPSGQPVIDIRPA